MQVPKGGSVPITDVPAWLGISDGDRWGYGNLENDL